MTAQQENKHSLTLLYLLTHNSINVHREIGAQA